MLEKLNKGSSYTYQKLTEEEIKERGILGRLVGNVADFINPTRNGRKYSEDLWEKVFDNPLMKEKFKNKVMYGELGHPEGRTEIDPEKIAVCMAEPPKKDSDGTLKAVFDILPTPNGKILKALCDYGSILGVSSRGTGDVITDDEGNEMVDPDTYDCECWDIVLVPAVESARLQYVTESLDKNTLNLKRALCESLNSASEEDRKVMEETLHELDIDIEDKKDVNPEKEEHIDAESESSEQTNELEEANNDGSDEIIKSLQEAIKEKSELEAQVKQLQEQLAVSDAKVGKLEEDISKYKSTTVKMSTLAVNNKDLETKVSSLEEELKAKAKTIETQKLRISKLVSDKKESSKNGSKSMNEELSKKDNEIKILNENFNEVKNDYESKIKELTENLETLKSDSESKDKELNEKLDRETRLKESYKKLANKAINHYMESKAVMLGVTIDAIKNKLPESYTIEDVDSICESLQSYELNMNKLPFSVDRKVKVKVSKSTNESLNPNAEYDNDVDESLYRLAGLM